MFPYFRGGIQNTVPSENLHIQNLERLTRQNPKSELINEIRKKRLAEDITYKEMKRGLDYITPACIVKRRSLKGNDFHYNFLASSGYVFIDFDFADISNAHEHKSDFISKYGDSIAYCAISSSLGGLSVLIRVNASIASAEEYKIIWQHLVDNVFTDYIADISTKDIGRAMFLSSDPDVFVNYNSLIDLRCVQLNTYGTREKDIDKDIEKNTRSHTKSNIKRRKDKGYEGEVLVVPDYRNNSSEKFIYRTQIEVKNPFVDIEEREYTEVFFNRNIRDNEKHKTYIANIHKLVHLNPHHSKDDILHYILKQNACQKNKMEDRRVRELVDYYWNEIHTPDYKYKGLSKTIHFNKDSGLTRHQMKCISSRINGALRKNKSITSIQEAKALLEASNRHVSKVNVVELTKLGRTTVSKYFNSEPLDIVELEKVMNEIATTFPAHPDPDRKNKKKEGMAQSIVG